MSSLCVYGDSGGGMACFRSIVRTERDWGGMTSLDFFFWCWNLGGAGRGDLTGLYWRQGSDQKIVARGRGGNDLV